MLTATVNPTVAAMHLSETVGVPNTLIEELRQIHQGQWDLEDLCRVPEATADTIAAAKRAIDASNSRRHRVIDLIDEHAHTVTTDAANARLYSETVGELCDRLLILDIKIRALANVGVTPTTALATAAHLVRLAVVLAQDIQYGQAVLPPRTGVKVYNSVVATSESDQ